MVALKDKAGIGEDMNKIIDRLAEEGVLKGGVIDEADFNSEKLRSGKEKVDKISKLISTFQDDNLGRALI